MGSDEVKVVIGVATAIGMAAIMYFGAREALAGNLTIGGMIVFSYLASLYRPLEAVAYSTSTVQGAAGSARRVLEILRSDLEVKEAPLPRPGRIPRSSRGGLYAHLHSIQFGAAGPACMMRCCAPGTSPRRRPSKEAPVRTGLRATMRP